jgi:hypothetical protein
MVHAQVQPLLALGLEGLDRAKWLFVCRLVAHCVALGLAITAALVVDTATPAWQIALPAGAIICELVAFWLHNRASDFHSRGRQVMRRVMLLDALQPEQAPVVLPQMQPLFGQPVIRKAMALQERDLLKPEKDRRLLNYYYSRRQPGQARLRDLLFESAIFSHHLYAAAWRFSLICLAVLLGLAAIAVTALVLGSGSTETMGALWLRLLIALVAFVPACQEVDHLLLYRSVEEQLGQLLGRVEGLYAETLNDQKPHAGLLADVGDYCAATTFAPPIRTLVYKALVDRLAVEFEQKMRDLEKGREVASRRVAD